METSPNIPEIQQFFNFLFGVPDGIIAYGWQDCVTNKFIEGWKTGICRSSFVLQQYETIKKQFPDSLPNLHVTLNETSVTPVDGSYRSRKSIKSSRVICVDLDRPIDDRELDSIATEYKPALVIESSPSRYHLYWKLTPGGISIKSAPLPSNLSQASSGSTQSQPPWTMYQLAFASKLSGDLSRSDITSTIRVPGFPRLTKDKLPFTPYIVGISFTPMNWTEAELVSRFPWIPEQATLGLKTLTDSRKQIALQARQRAQQLRESYNGSLPSLESVTAPAGRNSALYEYINTLAYETGLTESDAETQALAINQAFQTPPGPLDADEALSAAMNGYHKGFAAYQARQARLTAVIEPIESANPTASLLAADIKLSITNAEQSVSDSLLKVEVPLSIDITHTHGSTTVIVRDGDHIIDHVLQSNGLTDVTKVQVSSVVDDLTSPVLLEDISSSSSEFGRVMSDDGLLHSSPVVFDMPIQQLVDSAALSETSPETSVITEPAADEESSNGTTESHKNGKHIDHKNSTEKAEKEPLHIEPLHLNNGNTKDSSPAKPSTALFCVKDSSYTSEIETAIHINDCAKKFARLLWRNHSEAITLLMQGIASRSFQQFAEYLADLFAEVGSYTRQGMTVSLHKRTEWGVNVTYLRDLQKENLPDFCRRALKLFSNKYITDDSTKDIEGSLKKPLTDRQMQDITRLFIDASVNHAPIEIQDSDLIVFQNGYFTVSTGIFTVDHNAPVNFSNPIMAHYDPEELKLPHTFFHYMAEWFPGDLDIITWMLRWYGYCMTTNASRQVFAFFYGPTRAGKGSLAKLLCELIGTQNYTSIEYKSLVEPFRFSSAAGKLVISIEEVRATEKENETIVAQIKKISGGEQVQFNQKFKQPYEEKITAKMLMQSNEALTYQDKGHALQARMMSVGFEQSFTANAKQDPYLEILRADANVLASCAARAYSAAVQAEDWNLCFKFPNSRALQYGYAEVTEQISIDAFICSHYLLPEVGKTIRSPALLDLFQLCIDGNVSPSNKRAAQFYAEILATFGSKHVKRNEQIYFHSDKKRSRGFENLTINKETLIIDHPELLEDSNNLSSLYPFLFEALEISLTDHKINPKDLV